MKLSRRSFIKNIAITGAAGIAFPSFINGFPSFYNYNTQKLSPALSAKDYYGPLSDIHKIISQPVFIKDIRIWKIEKDFIVETIAENGLSGYAVANNRLPDHLTMFKNLIIPYLVGKDGRDILHLMEDFYYTGVIYKFAGLPLWNCFAHAEVGILDILGKAANKSLSYLLGTVLRSEVPVYLSSSRRDTTPEEEFAWLKERIEDTGARAIKVKIGGRMSKNKDAYPGRTNLLIPYLRQKLGDDFIIYVDANGSYDVHKAIEIGKWLEGYKIGFFEEPCEWEDFVSTKRVADALDIIIAGGEQDSSIPKILWMLENKAIGLIQPDIMYNGGILRTLKVAKMAEEFGVSISPHCPRNNPALNHMLQFASVVSNLGPFQEFKADLPTFNIDYRPELVAVNGKIKIPDGPGLGISYDPLIWRNAEKII